MSTSASVMISEEGPIAILVFSNGPHNHLDEDLLNGIADALQLIDDRDHLRAVVLASAGKHFCAGAHLVGDRIDPTGIYRAALRIFKSRKPIIAAVQGSAIGGGLGLALAADFRVASGATRFSANFVRLGLHPGFGLSISLPHLIGHQAASLLLMTGRRVCGNDALALGLCDKLVPTVTLRDGALMFAAEIAQGAPLALLSIRATLRRDLIAALPAQITVEVEEQTRLFATHDFEEGVRAAAERRVAQWACK